MPVPGFKSAELYSAEIEKLVNEALGFKKESNSRKTGNKPAKKGGKKSAKKGSKKTDKKSVKKGGKKVGKKTRTKETLGLNYG